MSVTVSNCFEIARSCLNTSKAKQLYSFPKESRFTHESRMQNHNPSQLLGFYDARISAINQEGGVKIGTERKPENIFIGGTTRDRTPSPGQYNTRNGTFNKSPIYDAARTQSSAAFKSAPRSM